MKRHSFQMWTRRCVRQTAQQKTVLLFNSRPKQYTRFFHETQGPDAVRLFGEESSVVPVDGVSTCGPGQDGEREDNDRGRHVHPGNVRRRILRPKTASIMLQGAEQTAWRSLTRKAMRQAPWRYRCVRHFS